MKEIGGYFGLELPLNKDEYHKNAIRLNNARSALLIILQSKRFNRIFLPFYNCDVVLEPFEKLNLEFFFYRIDKNFRPIFDFEQLNKDDLFIYVNYFGICNNNLAYIIEVQSKINFYLAIDNSQSFYSKGLLKENIYSFNSARKFFGVPDGSYLYGNLSLESFKLSKQESYKLAEHLLLRIDLGATFGYSKSKENDQSHSNLRPMYMSNLSRSILETVDYEQVKQKRLNNFLYMNSELNKLNELDLIIKSIEVPMVYPFLVEQGHALRTHLINNKVFIAKYWPNRKIKLAEESHESYLTDNLVAIPIDQRYSINDMKYILSCIKKFYNKGE